MKADTVLIGAKESWLLILFNCLPPIFLLNTSSISPTLSLTRCIISQTQKQATHMQPEKILISRENRHQPPRAASLFADAPSALYDRDVSAVSSDYRLSGGSCWSKGAERPLN